MLRTSFFSRWPKALFFPKNIGLLVFLFSGFVVFHTTWQLWFGLISVSDAIAVIINFLAPISFFYFFRFLGSLRDLHIFMVFFVVSVALISAYWVFDSYNMWLSGRVLDYSSLALEYSQMRDPDAEMNTARVEPFHRAYGLLVNHSVSAGCVALMCFAILSFKEKSHYWVRGFVILVSCAVLTIGQNTTGLVAFVLTILFVEYEFIRLSFLDEWGRKRCWRLCLFAQLLYHFSF